MSDSQKKRENLEGKRNLVGGASDVETAQVSALLERPEVVAIAAVIEARTGPEAEVEAQAEDDMEAGVEAEAVGMQTEANPLIETEAGSDPHTMVTKGEVAGESEIRVEAWSETRDPWIQDRFVRATLGVVVVVVAVVVAAIVTGDRAIHRP